MYFVEEIAVSEFSAVYKYVLYRIPKLRFRSLSEVISSYYK